MAGIERTGARLTFAEQASRNERFRERPLAMEVVKMPGKYVDRRAANVLANLPEVLTTKNVRIKAYTPMGLELSPTALIGKSAAEIDHLASSIDTLSQAYKVNLADQVGVKMITLSAGEFIFQGTEGVAFKGCKIAEVPFTNGQFRKLLELEPEKLAAIVSDPFERLERSLSKVDPDYKHEAEDVPMVYVSQTEASGIAKLLGKRLLTELERERAAAYTNGRKYPFGNTFDETKVTFNGRGTRSVYAHKNGASPEGILDLAGNVWEWTATPYGEIDLSDPENPKLPSEGDTFALRGGSGYYGDFDILQGDCRDFYYPDGQFNHIGFRLAED